MKWCRQCLDKGGPHIPSTHRTSFIHNPTKARIRWVNCYDCGFIWVDSEGRALTPQPPPRASQREMNLYVMGDSP